MKTRRVVRMTVVLTVIAMAIAAAAAAASVPRTPDQAQSEHARIVAYWTPERMAQATPRDLFVDPVTRTIVPTKGKPPWAGGGGGGTQPALEPQWDAGGLVETTTGKVFFTMGRSNYVCSGSVVDDSSPATSLVLTAGHCVYNENAKGRQDPFATNWMFVPDYQATPDLNCFLTPQNCWTATALVTTQAWAQKDFNYDIGFAVIPGVGAEDLQLDVVAGSQAIGFAGYPGSHPATVYAFGYPQASPYDGKTLRYCTGTDTADSASGSFDFGLTCGMTGGSSGGPWFLNFDVTLDSGTFGTGTLTSVNSYKYTNDDTTMYGPYFGNYAEATYTAAERAAGNTTVPAPSALP